LLTNAVYYRTGWLSDAIMDRYVRVLNSYEADVVICYPSALYEMVKFIERRGLRVPKPKAIVCSSEVLQDFIREKAEEVFGVKVYDFYGANEANAIAGECKHESMHVFTFNNRVETMEMEGCGGAGKVVVTPLHNFTMPLLRYENDDVALPGGGRCGCGSPLPTMGRIVGRTMQFLVKEDGGLVHAFRFMPLFNTNSSIHAFQVIQEDCRRIRVTVVANEGERAWQERTEDEMRKLMGPDCRVVWEFVDEIPRTPMGKYLYVKSLVHRD
jgi:phenylacetate-CoA ligase